MKVVFSSNHMCIMRNRRDNLYTHWPIAFEVEVESLLGWLLGIIEAETIHHILPFEPAAGV